MEYKIRGYFSNFQSDEWMIKKPAPSITIELPLSESESKRIDDLLMRLDKEIMLDSE